MNQKNEAIVKEVFQNIFMIKLPLDSDPIGSNVFLIKGTNENFLVDTGDDIPETPLLLDRALKDLDISWDSISIILTHTHSDHLGGLERIWKPSMKVFSPVDPLSEQKEKFDQRLDYFLKDFREFCNEHPSTIKSSKRAVISESFFNRTNAPVIQVFEGDEIKAGDYRLKVIETSGHDFCGASFWEPDQKLLFSGDVLMDSAVSTAYVVGFEDALGEHLRSLEKINAYDATLVLPGHGDPFADVGAHVQKAQGRHMKRVKSAYGQVILGHHTIMDICYELTQLPRRTPWEQRGGVEQWKAMCETVGHLSYLEHRGFLKREMKKGTAYYFLCPDGEDREEAIWSA